MVNNTDLDTNFNLQNTEVRWFYRSGRTWAKFRAPALQNVIDFNPDLLYIELGGNDLDSQAQSETILHM